MEQRFLIYMSPHCDRMLQKKGRCLPLATWEDLRNEPIALPQQETKAWRIPVILKVMLWLKEGQGRMVSLQFHDFIAF